MELADGAEKDRDMSEDRDTEKDLDSYLEYGRYQAIRVWVLGSLLGNEYLD